MKLYSGIDLHSNNNYLVIIDDQEKRSSQKGFPNGPEFVALAELLLSRSHSAGTSIVRLPLLSIGLTRPEASIWSTIRAARL